MASSSSSIAPQQNHFAICSHLMEKFDPHSKMEILRWIDRMKKMPMDRFVMDTFGLAEISNSGNAQQELFEKWFKLYKIVLAACEVINDLQKELYAQTNHVDRYKARVKVYKQSRDTDMASMRAEVATAHKEIIRLASLLQNTKSTISSRMDTFSYTGLYTQATYSNTVCEENHLLKAELEKARAEINRLKAKDEAHLKNQELTQLRAEVECLRNELTQAKAFAVESYQKTAMFGESERASFSEVPYFYPTLRYSVQYPMIDPQCLQTLQATFAQNFMVPPYPIPRITESSNVNSRATTSLSSTTSQLPSIEPQSVISQSIMSVSTMLQPTVESRQTGNSSRPFLQSGKPPQRYSSYNIPISNS